MFRFVVEQFTNLPDNKVKYRQRWIIYNLESVEYEALHQCLKYHTSINPENLVLMFCTQGNIPQQKADSLRAHALTLPIVEMTRWMLERLLERAEFVAVSLAIR